MVSRFLSVLVGVMAFVSQSHSFMVGKQPSPNARISTSSTELQIGNWFGGILGQGESSSNDGPKTVVELPATTVKVGPLRFFLQIYLVAEQNKPVKGSWVLNTNEANQSLDMYYKDGTGMFSVGLNEKSVKITRYGQSPSMEYVLQESVMVHGILDELHQIAFEVEDVEREKRLLQLVDDDAIDKARETLPARKEEEEKN